jgi:hypothetical protein
MEWMIEYLQDDDLLYIKTKGFMTREVANAMVQDIVEAMNRYQCKRHIVDHRDTTFLFNLTEYYERPEVNRRIGLSHSWKIAILFKELTEDTLFMETVFRNRGFLFRQFDDLDDARAWILT